MNPVNTVVAVHCDVEDENIRKIQQFLLDKYNSRFAFRPHITFLLMPISTLDFEKLLPVLRLQMQNIKSFTALIQKVYFDPKDKYYSLTLDQQKLLKVHKILLSTALPFRHNALREKDIERIKKGYWDKEQVQYLHKYGFPRVMDKFHAHISLGTVEKEGVDLDKIVVEIRLKLKTVLRKGFEITRMTLMHHVDSERYENMDVLYEEVVNLK